MSKNKRKSDRDSAPAFRSQSNLKRWIPVVSILVVAVLAAVVILALKANRTPPAKTAPPLAPAPAAPAPAPTVTPAPTTTSSKELVTMEVAKAVMVTVELDFGSKIPSIAEAITQIERRYQPDDGQGRTFAVLDAYGESTPDGKLHMSMHVSSEKPGGGQLIFKKTGEVLWRGKINPTSQPVQPKNLTVLLDNGKGTTMTVDGSSSPSSIIDAKVKPGDLPVRDVWPDGQERELTFIYSACGCPVKVFAKRVGERTARVSETPVIFPDDPAAVSLITRLMKW
jgi:flagellar basal body-associated protein FliL